MLAVTEPASESVPDQPDLLQGGQQGPPAGSEAPFRLLKVAVSFLEEVDPGIGTPFGGHYPAAQIVVVEAPIAVPRHSSAARACRDQGASPNQTPPFQIIEDESGLVCGSAECRREKPD